MRETRIEVAGVATSVAESGTPGAEEAILAVHGNPGSRHDWLGLLDALGEQHRTIALDLPGFGEADKPKAFAYDVPGYAAWLDAALTVLGVRRVHLLLHDWGGPFGVAWALRDPSRVASLAAVNAGGVSRDYRWHGFARAWQVPVLGELIQYTTTGPTFRASMAKLNPRPLAREDLDRMWRLNDRATRRVALRLYRSDPDPGDLPRRAAPVLAPLDLPAIAVWGDRDPFIAPEHAERVRDLAPSAQVVHMPGSGHWPMLDAPEEVEAALVAFYAEPTRPGVRARAARQHRIRARGQRLPGPVAQRRGPAR